MPYDTNNIFARILRGEIPAKKVYEDEHVLAFYDIAQAAPVHVLVIPKGEYISFDDFLANAGQEATHRFFASVHKIANDLELEKTGYRIITNHGPDALQSVPHFHVHILGGATLAGWEQMGAAQKK